MTNFGINGFGRIGRTSLRVWWKVHKDEIDRKMINTSGSMELENWVHLLKYDTNYGQFDEKLSFTKQQSNKEVTDENPVLGTITIGEGDNAREIVVTAQRDPKKLPWGTNGVDTVLESTGVFRTEETAAFHFEGGARKVIISAPGKGGNVSTSVIGINDFKDDANVLSNASCTTNCVAPVAQLMVSHYGLE